MENSSNRAIRDLGIFYCAVYVVSLTVGSLALWLYWDAWQLDSLMQSLASVTTVSAGTALLATIFKEMVWFMVLAAMKIKEWKDQGREEGLEAGREEGLEAGQERQRKREEEAYLKFGVEMDGVLMLPRTPEVARFLSGDPTP